MYKIALAKIGKPQGIIIQGFYDEDFLKLTFNSVEEAGAYLSNLHGMKKATYDVIKVD
jgi:hypothetical protein